MSTLDLKIIVGIGLAASVITPSWAQSDQSSPRDTTPYFRPAIPSDTAGPAASPQFARPATRVIRVVDTVISNTDPNLQNTDHFNNGETSIAINPINPREIVISAFSGSWGNPQPNAPLWHSMNDGQTWTKVFVIPAPPGAAGTGGCPCDQTYDYGRNNVLFGSILTEIPATGFGNIYTGSTTNPKNAASWKWFTTFGNAQLTNEAADALDMSDQPWMLHNRGALHANSQNVFAAYDDFSTNPRGLRVARSINNVPPQFAVGSDPIVGTSAAGTNPGHRLATDPRNGWVYSLFQNCTTCTGDPKTIQYMLNRSTDQGSTWTLNSSATGIDSRPSVPEDRMNAPLQSDQSSPRDSNPYVRPAIPEDRIKTPPASRGAASDAWPSRT